MVGPKWMVMLYIGKSQYVYIYIYTVYYPSLSPILMNQQDFEQCLHGDCVPSTSSRRHDAVPMPARPIPHLMTRT